MTYLQLINNVLTRLREDPITAAEVDNNFSSNAYWRSIGAHVNDAKDRVEDAWQWGAQRGTDEVDIVEDQVFFACPDSADNHYILKRILVKENGNFLRWITIPNVRSKYAGVGTGSGVPKGTPTQFATSGEVQEEDLVSNGGAFPDDQLGNHKYALFPSSSGAYTLEIDRAKHQDALVAATDRLLVPSLPVYTLATALASRERGEVGGTPTSELFAIADRHLSDAIAQDSARYADELDWFSAGEGWVNTNLRNH
jgi:hypothetical protein